MTDIILYFKRNYLETLIQNPLNEQSNKRLSHYWEIGKGIVRKFYPQ